MAASLALKAQDTVTANAKKIIKEFASAGFYGRGYVKKGDSLAADYIKNKFTLFGLQPLPGNNYYQNFNISVNTFPAKAELTGIIKNNKEIAFTPGIDFMVNPYSLSISGEFTLLFHKAEKIDQLVFNRNEKVILVLDTHGLKNQKTQKEIHNLLYSITPGLQGIVFLHPYNKKEKKIGGWDIVDHRYSIACVDASREKFSNLKKVKFNIESVYIKQYTTRNVAGYIKGSQQPDSFIVITAHYDHLGMMGERAVFLGANDNASGIAMLLSLADYFSKEQNRPAKSIVFIAFGAEEGGLLGSEYFVKHPMFPLKSINALINFDLLGTGEEGIMVVNGSVLKNEFSRLNDINEKNKFVSAIKARGKAANSDHYHFSEKGVKAIYIYTLGGIKAYHDVHDKPETLPLTAFSNIYELMLQYVKSKF